MGTFDDEWAADFQRRFNARMFGPGVFVDELHYFTTTGKLYTGSPGDTSAPRYCEPGLTNTYRCTCGCSEATHQLPGGHCLMPSCRDEPCTVKAPDPWLEQVKELCDLREYDTSWL